jgi:hypothetical protein
MLPVAHPEVLSNDWLSPAPIGREREVQEVVRRLDAPTPVAPPPWVVAVGGGSGSGTSTVARRAAREVVERLRRTPGGAGARLLHVRVASLKGPHGVATELLRRLDDGFDGRGFPVAEILAGLLRRLKREARPFVVVLDDVGLGSPDLAPVLRALAAPDRFLPEGEHGLPPWWTVLAGTLEGVAGVARGVADNVPLGPPVPLSAYRCDVLAAIVRDRSERALGRPAPSDLVERVVAAAVEDGGGSRRAVDLLRRELLGGGHAYRPGFVPRHGDAAVRIEPSVVEAIRSASRGRPAHLGDLRRAEAELARRHGLEPLPTTTLWRRIVRLEQAGYVRREIRTGGSGGTRSVVRVLTPIDEWVTVPSPPQTRRASLVIAGGLGEGTPGPARPTGWPAVPAG